MLLNYTTKIDPDKTCAEIGKILSSHGAIGVMTEYDQKDHLVSALRFMIQVGERKMMFKLPADWRPVQKVLQDQREKGRRSIDTSQEEEVRVAWRILKDWMEAQMALVETQMVTTQEVFLLYMMTRDGRTLSEKVIADPRFYLGSGE